ncbi:hypothetical protein CEXT_81841 [Caerostris extrusa]|uniref:Uncharacterized protein n=1 Tax=Caerostris extrusa TaxID=172846 RepID=A0AAV4X0A1_CAEEX|nr:hypothetical protein CEXT_81841 [Caerostris extrusa]
MSPHFTRYDLKIEMHPFPPPPRSIFQSMEMILSPFGVRLFTKGRRKCLFRAAVNVIAPLSFKVKLKSIPELCRYLCNSCGDREFGDPI